MTDCIRELVLNCEYPIIFRHAASWEIVTWNLQDWSNVFKDETLPFRCAAKSCQKTPQWEGDCQTKHFTMDEFIQFCNNKEAVEKEWRYFDYKHMAEFSKSKINLFKTLSWNNVGFPDRDAENSTIWIGSPGSHTPCHLDTYGSNVVAEVYGNYPNKRCPMHRFRIFHHYIERIYRRDLHFTIGESKGEHQIQNFGRGNEVIDYKAGKRWLLFPPSETNNLKPTRVPYEESSIYSNINFSCFENCQDEDFENCYAVDLNPGDVLLVPARWWHYVENLSTAISINTWIPHKNDDHWRLEEALVRYFISSVINSISEVETEMILNPNEFDIEESVRNLDVLNLCKMKCREKVFDSDTSREAADSFQNESHNHEYKRVPKVSKVELKKIMKQTSACKPSENETKRRAVTQETDDLISVINAFCHPDIIHEVGNKLLKQ